jgi:hypothetical protein
MNAKQWIQRGVPAAISIGALAWLFGTIDPDALFGALNWRVVYVLVPSLLAYGAVALLLEANSILWLIDPRPADFGAWTAARIKCASYLLGIVNYALGAAALSVLLQKRAELRLAEAASVVLLIASVDMIVVLLLASTGAALAGDETPSVRAGIVAIAGLGFFGGMALLRIPGSLGPLERIRSLTLFDALRTTPFSRLIRVALLRLGFSGLFITLAWTAFFAFDIEIGATRLIVGMMVVAVVSALPIAVAGLGTGQAATLMVFQGVAPQGELLALSLVLSAGMIMLRTAMGIVFAREFTREVLEETRSAPA